jgi:hypothetical protein
MAEFQIVAAELSSKAGIIAGAMSRQLEHIQSVTVVDFADGGKKKTFTVQQVIDRIEANPPVLFFVEDSQKNKANVSVVNGNPKYIRTRPDGIFTDNLLALPTF